MLLRESSLSAALMSVLKFEFLQGGSHVIYHLPLEHSLPRKVSLTLRIVDLGVYLS